MMNGVIPETLPSDIDRWRSAAGQMSILQTYSLYPYDMFIYIYIFIIKKTYIYIYISISLISRLS